MTEQPPTGKTGTWSWCAAVTRSAVLSASRATQSDQDGDLVRNAAAGLRAPRISCRVNGNLPLMILGASMAGLEWLGHPPADNWPLCLTFVRGKTEGEVLAAFGAGPAASSGPAAGHGPQAPSVRVGRSGEWLVAVEENIPPQGTRPEVLRRVSAGATAVSVYNDIGKFNDEFACAADGEVVAAVTTSVPPHWSGTDPAWAWPVASALGLTEDATGTDLTPWQAVLALAEVAFGASLDESALREPWPSAQIVPVLKDLPGLPARCSSGIGDPVIDLLLARTDDAAVTSALAARAGRLMSATGLDSHRDLAGVVHAALAGTAQPVRDEEPAGLVLQQLAWEGQHAQDYLAALVNLPPQPVTRDELRQRIRRGEAAWLLRFVLAGRYRQALAAEIGQQRAWRAPGWREQARADLADVQVPDAELRASEQALQEDPLAGAVGWVNADPVRRHVRRLIQAGVDPGQIAEIGGLTTLGVQRLLDGQIRNMHAGDARRLLAMQPSDR
jgi:Family of unknown function (DUF6461)